LSLSSLSTSRASLLVLLCAREAKERKRECRAKGARNHDEKQTAIVTCKHAPAPDQNGDEKTHLLLAVALVSGTCPATRTRRHLAEERRREEKERMRSKEGESEKKERESRGISPLPFDFFF
jgi:hypothetical protein